MDDRLTFRNDLGTLNSCELAGVVICLSTSVYNPLESILSVFWRESEVWFEDLNKIARKILDSW